jgi:hypothetical protein
MSRGLYGLADLITPMAIRVAATLRLADRIAAGTTTLIDFAANTGADPDALGRLLLRPVTRRCGRLPAELDRARLE